MTGWEGGGACLLVPPFSVQQTDNSINVTVCENMKKLMAVIQKTLEDIQNI